MRMRILRHTWVGGVLGEASCFAGARLGYFVGWDTNGLGHKHIDGTQYSLQGLNYRSLALIICTVSLIYTIN